VRVLPILLFSRMISQKLASETGWLNDNIIELFMGQLRNRFTTSPTTNNGVKIRVEGLFFTKGLGLGMDLSVADGRWKVRVDSMVAR